MLCKWITAIRINISVDSVNITYFIKEKKYETYIEIDFCDDLNFFNKIIKCYTKLQG